MLDGWSAGNFSSWLANSQSHTNIPNTTAFAGACGYVYVYWIIGAQLCAGTNSQPYMKQHAMQATERCERAMKCKLA